MADTYTIASLAEDDFDRAISILFAPSAKRRLLCLSLGLDRELIKIPRQTSDVFLRRIRLQFWRDALLDREGSGHPLARELVASCGRNSLRHEMFGKLMNIHEQSWEEPADQSLVQENIEARQCILFELFAHMLDASLQHVDQDLLRQCGRAYGGALDLCRSVGVESKDKAPYENHLAEVEKEYRGLKNRLIQISPAVRPAFLPLVFVLPYLDLVKASQKTASSSCDLNPMKKVWMLWRTARKGF